MRSQSKRMALGSALAAAAAVIPWQAVHAQQSGSGSGGAAGGFAGLVWLVVVVLMIVAMWKLFTKAGRPGWASIIPFYNYVVMLQITGKSGWWLLGMFVPFLNLFVIIRLAINLAQVFGKGVGFGIGNLLLPFIFLPILAFGDAQYVGPGGQRAGMATAPSAA